MIYRQFFYFGILAFVLITLFIIWINIKYQQKARKANEYTNILTSNINDAVISTNLNWEILSWNEGAEKIYGWTKEEATGKVIYELLKTEYLHLTRDQVLQEVNKNGHVETEIIHTAKNGKKLNIRFSKSGVTDDNGKLTRIITINKNITAFREMEAMLKQSNQQLEEKVAERTKELNKSNSLYQFISHVNQLIINTRNEQELFDGICEIAIKDGGFKMAWIGLIDENEMVNPLAIAGHNEGYLSFIKKITVKDTPEGRGPTGKALREGTYYVCQDNTADPSVAPWLAEQLKRGFRSSIALQLKNSEK
ncbi:MAG: PAS domain S-box protein [Lacibacter sp.]